VPANPTDEGGIIAVSVEDVPLAATSPVVDALAEADIELGAVVICSSISGGTDVFVSATAPVPASCQ